MQFDMEGIRDMHLKTVRIELDPAEIQRVLSIGWDDNQAEALAFVKDVICKRIEKALQPQ